MLCLSFSTIGYYVFQAEHDRLAGRKRSGAVNSSVGALSGAQAAREHSAMPPKHNTSKPGRACTLARSQSPSPADALRDHTFKSAIPSATMPSPQAAVHNRPDTVGRNAASTLPRPPSRSQSRGRTHTEPTPPPASPPPSSQAAVSRRHRFLGPMPEAPPTSVLQSRPATSRPRSRTAIGAMRQQQYQASSSPPGWHCVSHPRPRSHLPSGLPQPQSHSLHPAVKDATLRRSVEARISCSPDRPVEQQIYSSGTQEQTSAASIRHRSTTPVRITKDAQLRRDKAAANHYRLPSQDSPLRRRATSVARAAAAPPSRQSCGNLPASNEHPHKPTPPQHPRTISSHVTREAASAASAPLARPPAGPGHQFSKDAPAPVASRATSGVRPVVGMSERMRQPPDLAAVQAEDQLEGYELGPVIGEGGFCKVKSGRHIASNQPVAIKVINKVRHLSSAHSPRELQC